MAGPSGDEAQQVAQIGQRLDVVQPGAGEQRHEDGVHEGAVVAADEEPIAAPEDLAPQVELADVVSQGETPVVEEAAQGDALIARVADRRRQRRLIQHLVDLGVAPFEESIHERSRLRAPYLLLLAARRVRDGPFDSKQRRYVREGRLRSLGLRSERFEKVPSTVAQQPTSITSPSVYRWL